MLDQPRPLSQLFQTAGETARSVGVAVFLYATDGDSAARAPPVDCTARQHAKPIVADSMGYGNTDRRLTPVMHSPGIDIVHPQRCV